MCSFVCSLFSDFFRYILIDLFHLQISSRRGIKVFDIDYYKNDSKINALLKCVQSLDIVDFSMIAYCSFF